MKNKNLLLLALIMVIVVGVGGLFYWFQIRTLNIKKSCYAEAFRPNEDNFEWAQGKIWTYVGAFASDQNGWVYPDYLDVRGSIYDAANMVKKTGEIDERAIILSSMAKAKEIRNKVYKQCLVREGISTSL